MNLRAAAVAVCAVLLGVNVALVALVVVPVPERDHRPADEAFEVGAADSYRLTAAITVDGETVLAVDGAVARSGERFVRTVEESVTSEQYRNGTDGPTYTRLVLDGGAADRRLRQLRDDPDREVVDTERDGETLTVVTVTEAPQSAVYPSGAASVVATELRLAAYERVGSTDGGARVLRPESGWYEGRRPYRLGDATGEVVVDPATDILVSADVRWRLTRGTQTYAHYLLHRPSAVTETVTYEYRPGNVSVSRPGWVDDAGSGGSRE